MHHPDLSAALTAAANQIADYIDQGPYAGTDGATPVPTALRTLLATMPRRELWHLVDTWPYPAIISKANFEVAVSNSQIPHGNLMVAYFEARDMYAASDTVIPGLIGQCRREVRERPDDRRLRSIIGDLQDIAPESDDYWHGPLPSPAPYEGGQAFTSDGQRLAVVQAPIPGDGYGDRFTITVPLRPARPQQVDGQRRSLRDSVGETRSSSATASSRPGPPAA
jgi:hypothetical protein